MTAIPATLRSRRATSWVFRGSAFVLVAGLIAILVVIFGNSSGGTPASKKNEGAPQVVKTPKTVELAPGAIAVARKFVLTAAQRKNLDQAWLISGPQIRQGMTRAQFLKGEIPVVPVFGKIDGVSYRVVYSYPHVAEIEAAVYVKGPGKKSTGHVFFIQLNRVGSGKAARWVVNAWVPNVPIPVPAITQ